MSSAEIKERIVHYFVCSNVPTTEKDWKRVQKFSLNGENVREFFNSKLNRTVYTIGDDEDCGIYERDQWVYGISQHGDTLNGLTTGISYVFEPQDRWHRTGYVHDQHQQWILQFFHCLPDDLADETQENDFASPYDNVLKIHIALAKYGFKHDQTLTDFLNDTSNGPAPQTPTSPVNPPLPPALDPNWNPPQVAPTPPAPGALAAAAAASGPANLMAALGAALGPNTNVIGVGPGGVMSPISFPKLPPSGMFNAPGMQAALPLMAGQWPELVNLQPAVQAAFITQRSAGLKGLDQCDSTWEDDKKVKRELQAGNWVTLERSHAIWLLYEHFDDGNTVLTDYFTYTDDDLHAELCEMLDIDDEDEGENLEIIDDEASYPAPFDLPVPQPAPVSPFPAHNPGHPAPMRGPAAMNARAGSFAPLPAAPAAVAPPPPPPGKAEAQIKADSGDQWADFCREVWETYELNKANLPLDIRWYDRYRPREAQITGLGFQFVRRDFTGIRILMGYLDRDGKLIDNIDLPSAMLDELMATWGGDWNVDDITQDVFKRKGEDPETGFSYSSEGTWDEVKAYLEAQGWKEV